MRSLTSGKISAQRGPVLPSENEEMDLAPNLKRDLEQISTSEAIVYPVLTKDSDCFFLSAAI